MNKQSVFLFAMTALILIGLAACGKPMADVHAIGKCVDPNSGLCITYTVQTELNLVQQGTVSAIAQTACVATPVQGGGTFTGNVGCSTDGVVGYCTFGTFKADTVDVRQVAAATAPQASAAQQLCGSQGGSWTPGVPTF